MDAETVDMGGGDDLYLLPEHAELERHRTAGRDFVLTDSFFTDHNGMIMLQAVHALHLDRDFCTGHGVSPLNAPS
jgi:hypothetical protein